MIISFKPAVENDCDLLFKWVNDPSVRENAFNSRIIDYEEHKNWFEEILKSNEAYIYICYIEENPIGQIRIDTKGHIGEIDYSIDSKCRGNGYGTLLLIEIIPYIEKECLSIKKLIGKVKHTNKISQKAFIKAGYFEKYNLDYMEYSIVVK